MQKEVTETPTLIRMEDGLQYARSFGNSTIYPMTDSMPSYLGSALGFIDSKYALVALEEDALTAITADKYILTGVPTLNPEDIFPSRDDTTVSSMNWAAARGYDPNLLLQSALPALSVKQGLPAGFEYALRNGRITVRWDKNAVPSRAGIRVSIFTVMGRLARQWSPSELSSGSVSWSPSESGLAVGAFVLKIEVGAKKYSQAFYLH